MNKQELIKIYEDTSCTLISINGVLEDLRQLDEPQPIKLKDVIARIEKFDLGTKAVWINEILNKLGSDYGALKYKAGYEQGKVEGEYVGQQLKDADKIRQELNKPVVPQVVIDYYEFYKEKLVSFEEWFAKFEVESDEDFQRMDEVGKWLYDVGDFKTQTQHELALAMLIVNGLDAVEVEKEKRYRVSLKNGQPLLKAYLGKALYFSQDIAIESYKVTRKELEEAGFGDVFDSPLFEVEEVGE